MDTTYPRFPQDDTPLTRRMLEILLRWIPVGMGTYKPWDLRPRCGHFFGGVHWYGQETAMPAMTIATVLAALPNQGTIAGYPREELEDAVASAIRYLCFTHDTGPKDCVRPSKGLGRPEPAGTKWGERGAGFFRESQCGLGIANLAIAAALVGDRIDDEERNMLAAIARDYLGRFGDMEPKSGVYFDTQTEENAWTAVGLAACSFLVSGDAGFAGWQEQVKLWAFRTVVMPVDRHDTQVFDDGRSIRELTGRACTTLPDGTAENHGMVHPSYMASSISLLGRAMLLYRLFDHEIPPHLYHRLGDTYDLLKTWCDSSGIPQAPQGMDWPYFSLPQQTLLHTLAATELADPDGALLEERMLGTLEASSLAHGGRIVPEEAWRWCHGQQDPALMRERMISALAYAYLVRRFTEPGPAASDPAEFAERMRGVHVYPHGGLAVHNHTRGRTTVSWRNHTMVLPAPPEGMRIIGPAKGALTAEIVVEGAASTSKQRGFKMREDPHQICTLQIEDIAEEKLRRRLFFASTEDGEALVWERVWALQPARITSVSQGRLCIINDGLFGDHSDPRGRRQVWWPGGSRVFEGFVAEDASQDILVPLTEAKFPESSGRAVASAAAQFSWVNVDDRFTVAYCGSGSARYENPHHFPVWHAVHDDLVLCSHDETFDAQPGQVICEMLLVWVPEHQHTDAGAAAPTVEAWDGDRLIAQVGRWNVECSIPNSTDVRSARIAIQPVEENQ